MRCCCRYFTTSSDKYFYTGLTLERGLNISIQCNRNAEDLWFMWNWVSCLKYPVYIVFYCSRGKGWGVARKYLERVCRYLVTGGEVEEEERSKIETGSGSLMLHPWSLKSWHRLGLVTVIWTDPPINLQNIQPSLIILEKWWYFQRLIICTSSRRENIVQIENY